MKKTLLFTNLWLCLVCILYAQGRDSYWLLGYENNMGSSAFGGTDIIFGANESMNIQAHNRVINISKTFAAIANEKGELLFYTNGSLIGNKNHDTLETRLYHPKELDIDDKKGLWLPMMAVILPILSDTNQFYIFHSTMYYTNLSPFSSFGKNIYCTKIDKSLNNGDGGVVFANQVVLEDSTLSTGTLSVVRHGNGRDWWLVMPTAYLDQYYTLLIENDIPQIPILRTINEFAHTLFPAGGQCVFTPNGQKYLRHRAYGVVDMIAFDRCTGLMTNGKSFTCGTGGWLGIASSPNSRFLYVSENGQKINQYDLWVMDIATSKIEVAVHNGQGSIFGGFGFGYLAPNNKIYFVDNTNTLTVIENPDSLGLACNVLQHSVILPTINGNTVPNHPNYALSALDGSACDTLGLSNQSAVNSKQVKVYPNPAQNYVQVELPQGVKEATFVLYNGLGQVVHSQALSQQNTRIFIGNWTKGLYFYQAFTKEGKMYGKLQIE
ncbi:MAG: T9SS type A sorting domain-containing protein [Bacteroidia bacterium]